MLRTQSELRRQQVEQEAAETPTPTDGEAQKKRAGSLSSFIKSAAVLPEGIDDAINQAEKDGEITSEQAKALREEVEEARKKVGGE